MNELFKTEFHYVKGLETLINDFYSQFVWKAEVNAKLGSKASHTLRFKVLLLTIPAPKQENRHPQPKRNFRRYSRTFTPFSSSTHKF